MITRSGLALGLLCAAQFMMVLDASIVSVALPSIRADLGMGETSLQYVLSLYALTFGGCLILAGRAGDLFGRRRLFLAGLGLFTAASLACGLAESPAVLLGGRAAQGLGAAMVSPAALSLLLGIFTDEHERNRALGLWGALSAAGGATGLLLGGALTDSLGWEWVFLINLPLGAIVIVTVPRLVAESRDSNRHRLDVAGAVAVTAGLGLLLFGLTRGQEDGFTAALPVLLIVGALALLSVFVAAERRVDHPLVDFAVFRARTLTVANLAGMVLAMLIAAQSFFGTLYLQGVLGLSPLQTGLAILPVTLISFASSGQAARLVERFGLTGVLVAGLLISGSGVGLLAGVDVGGSYWTAVMPGYALFGLGLGASFVAFTIGATAGAPAAQRGLASGLLNTSQQLGFAIGVAALATIAGARTEALGGATDLEDLVAGYRLAFLCAFALALLAALAVLVLLRSGARPGVHARPAGAESLRSAESAGLSNTSSQLSSNLRSEKP